MPESLTHNYLADAEPLTIVEPEITTVVLKVNNYCELDCYRKEDGESGCYMFAKDTSYRGRPARMSLEVARQVGIRAREDAEAHDSHEKEFELHGGESMAFKPRALNTFLRTIQVALGDVDMKTAAETNGVNMTEDKLEVLLDYGTRLGISLDGDRQANRHRVFKNGRPSFDRVMETVELLNQSAYRHLFAGCISVANPENDPAETYDFFKNLLVPDGRPRVSGENPQLSLVMPLGNYTNPPYQDAAHRATNPYGQWLSYFDKRWLTSDDPERFVIKETLGLWRKLNGQAVNTDVLGGDTLRDITILTDGSYAMRDTLSMSADGITVLDANVFDHSFAEAAVVRRAKMQALGALTLSPICKDQCASPISKVCNGGTIAARFDERQPEAPFLNPAVTCGDLQYRITHMLSLRALVQLQEQHERIVLPLLPDVAYSTDRS
ncbi:MAG TPA: radical SAM protein [Candidatus Saccharimonadales bacterium]|nr:radical SAM protein [Candidatus Saccharimonadales bacterium]